jgi:hypothetical protein
MLLLVLMIGIAHSKDFPLDPVGMKSFSAIICFQMCPLSRFGDPGGRGVRAKTPSAMKSTLRSKHTSMIALHVCLLFRCASHLQRYGHVLSSRTAGSQDAASPIGLHNAQTSGQ